MDTDIRPVPIDKMVRHYDDEKLESRRARLEVLLDEYASKIETLTAGLEKAQSIHAFLTAEHENVKLAVRLAAGDIVRVVCPHCKGTGMRASAVTGGQVRAGSAFESVGSGAQSPTIDDRNKCKECDGKRWIIMPRFKG